MHVPHYEPTPVSDDDEWVARNIGRLPWWVSPRMIEERVGDIENEDDDRLWLVQENPRVGALRRGGKGHSGKGPDDWAIDLFYSKAIRKARRKENKAKKRARLEAAAKEGETS
jgi:hypothetical protein